MAARIEHALHTFEQSPTILQRFHKGRLVEQRYWEAEPPNKNHALSVRLSPYYFVIGQSQTAGLRSPPFVRPIKNYCTECATRFWRRHRWLTETPVAASCGRREVRPRLNRRFHSEALQDQTGRPDATEQSRLRAPSFRETLQSVRGYG